METVGDQVGTVSLEQHHQQQDDRAIVGGGSNAAEEEIVESTTRISSQYCAVIDGSNGTIPSSPPPSLGIVFDIDGTLVAETRRDFMTGIQIRPHAIDLIKWCIRRGHRVSIWTAGHTSWADTVSRKLCALVHNNEQHVCRGIHCNKTFDFVWCGKYMRKEKDPSSSKYYQRVQGDISDGELRCRWCEFYSRSCYECSCSTMGPLYCPCRETKDLRKVWYSSATSAFNKDNTLIVENTPQRCRFNYGNAIYVPTYRGGNRSGGDQVFLAFQNYVENVIEPNLSTKGSVRSINKCHHVPPSRPHACYRQSWWP